MHVWQLNQQPGLADRVCQTSATLLCLYDARCEQLQDIGMTNLRSLAGRPAFGRPKPAQTAWGKPTASAPHQQGQQQQQQAQAVQGNGFINQGWSDDDEDTQLHPDGGAGSDGEHRAQEEVDEGCTEQVQPTLNTPREAQCTPPLGCSPNNAKRRSLFVSFLPCILE